MVLRARVRQVDTAAPTLAPLAVSPDHVDLDTEHGERHGGAMHPHGRQDIKHVLRASDVHDEGGGTKLGVVEAVKGHAATAVLG